MTFGELQRAVFDDFQYGPTPKPGVQDRVRRYLNEGLDRTLRRPRLKTLRFCTFPLVSAAGQGFYGAPMTLDRIDYIIDLTNRRRLAFRTRDWYRSQMHTATAGSVGFPPAPVSADPLGTPSVWIPEGFSPMLRYPRPSLDGYVYIWAIAPFPGDTTQTVTMDATFFYGDTYQSFAQLTGPTPVKINAQGMPAATRITSLTLNATTGSYVHFHDTAAPISPEVDPVAIIDVGELSSRHVNFRLYPTPSSPMHYEIEGLRAISPMRREEDEPPFPDAFHEMLACYARSRLYRKDGRLTQAGAEMGEYERFALDLTAYVEFPSNYRPVTAKLSSQVSQWSNLGPNYPADRGGLLSD